MVCANQVPLDVTGVIRVYLSNILDAVLELGLRLLQLRERAGEVIQFLLPG